MKACTFSSISFLNRFTAFKIVLKENSPFSVFIYFVLFVIYLFYCIVFLKFVLYL